MAHATSSSFALSAEENSLFVDILHEAPLSSHRQPRSILGSILYCFLLASCAVLAATAPWIFFVMPKLIPAMLCSCNAILLVITGLFQQYLVYQVKKVRLQGYYMFSEKLKHLARLPFATTAYGCIHQYNSLNGQPDILKSLYSALQPSSSLQELRYHDGGRLSDQQMALLQYQRENLHYLGEEVLRLQELLSKYQRADDRTTPQVDLAHLLAARDQELRALSAEMNQMQSELRLARNLIAERDNEIQLVRATNNQYIEENERLRAILSEWSTRAAKLERALDAERGAAKEMQKSIAKMRSHSPRAEEQR
ncbi:hypothetical protein HPP92_004366 [Vanilla planifolia]|uniref:Uncharacterized protein n=1 Tax=Vanilla planifolia TaxID=51239 RepID=A0A835VJT6_VANPL|nr:hypothetical protein HPP92_004366 [Vanilla planifolia]